MERNDGETAEAWYARVVDDFEGARANEDQQWSRLRHGQSPNGHCGVDDAYRDAVDRTDRAKMKMFEAAKAVDLERPI